jgi:8-oxo-dGTP diphosphatase
MSTLPEGPSPTADVIIELASGGIVLVERRFPPPGWAIPGGFIEVGESAETAAVREAREETGLVVTLTDLLGVYSDPRRDPRRHTLTVVYIGRAEGTPQAGDDAADAQVFTEAIVPSPLAFDHAQILADYFRFRRTGERSIGRT